MTDKRPIRIVAVSGSPTTPSKTTVLVREIADALAAKAGGGAEVEVIELSALRQDLAAGVWRAELGEPARVALDAVEAADVLIVGSPAYRATYTGLYKTFFDQVGQHAITDRPVLLASTAGAPGDAALVEHHLRALFAFFQARILPVGVPASDAEFIDKKEPTPTLRERIALAVERVSL
ncbi:NADPH-dependent FMN reductase [Herbiconiux sp. L3-i23]|uniref:NADPH-dependent FMN reductase n=1 Tax=Herbiconiux sp. L3-i23 TaxID=2905871 RepID=UPI00206323D4|nr:NAD(P)H-dependent oxidoreductase [Herbiconiux sp. L3-i23]BDI23398.1 FMN reductase [Herbiconiux sp. L3-i23]